MAETRVIGFWERLLADRKFRNAYAREKLLTRIAVSIRTLRLRKGWTQEQLAHAAGTAVSTISRLETIGGGIVSVQTLLDVASALDVALIVNFSSWPEFIAKRDIMKDLESVESFDQTFARIQAETQANSSD